MREPERGQPAPVLLLSKNRIKQGFDASLSFDFSLSLWYNMHKKLITILKATRGAKSKGGERMNEAAKEARRAYKRKWAQDNPDKVKAAQERYWTRQGEKLKQEKRTPAATGKD